LKIFVDIGHPGHVHYFKNFIRIMTDNEHQVAVIARDRDVINTLLSCYRIPFYSRGKGKDSFAGKLMYMLYADLLIYRKAVKFKPDLFISFSSPYAAQVSKLLRIPHLTLNDTEHTDSVHKVITYPFSEVIITPYSYQNNLGKKQIRLKSIIEFSYLHPELFTPDSSIYDTLGVKKNEKYVVLRFVSWNAFHDANQSGLSLDQKRQLISILEKDYRIFISSEKNIEPEFKKYTMDIPPERIHDALAYCSLFVGESGTMASESALLGVPSVYINSLPLMCYLKTQQDFGILKHFTNGNNTVEYVESILKNENPKKEAQRNRDLMIKDFVNPTNFLVWFVENWPESKQVIQNNPSYQDRFK